MTHPVENLPQPQHRQKLGCPRAPVILVPGGAGYIGSHTCKLLQQRGYLPVVYDHLEGGHAWAAPYGPLVVGSLLDEKALDKVFTQYRPQAVLHCAASIDVKESMLNPEAYYYNNVVGSLNLLRAMRRHGVRSLIFSSTAAVYGHGEQPFTETDPCRPVNVYGTTKWMVEQMIRHYEVPYGLNAVIFRYFNAAGADLEGQLGEAHPVETHLIPRAIATVLGRQTHLDVLGRNYPTPDGTAIRDYIHVWDVATAHLAALEWLWREGKSMTLNLGTGRGHSILDVVHGVETLAQRKIPLNFSDPRPGDSALLVADATLAQKNLGWRPQHSDLKTILETAYRWHALQPVP